MEASSPPAPCSWPACRYVHARSRARAQRAPAGALQAVGAVCWAGVGGDGVRGFCSQRSNAVADLRFSSQIHDGCTQLHPGAALETGSLLDHVRAQASPCN